MENQFSWWLPIDISTHGAEIDSLINLIHWFMAVLFIGWGIYLVYVLIRFRERPGHVADVNPRHFKIPGYIEIAIVIFEAVILIFLSSPIWFKYKKEFPPEKDALVVRLVAEQFAWNIHYPGKDGKFGRTKRELIDAGTNPIGLDRSDPDGKDDFTVVNNFHVPLNKPVIVHTSSKDVIHSLNIPVMRVKQDVVPGMEIPIWFQATKAGEYEIACAQLCGNGHFRMRGQFFVDSPKDFDKFVAGEMASVAESAANAAPAPQAPAAPAPEAGHDGGHH